MVSRCLMGDGDVGYGYILNSGLNEFYFEPIRTGVHFPPAPSRKGKLLHTIYDFDLRAPHMHTHLPAALAPVSFGFISARVREGAHEGVWGKDTNRETAKYIRGCKRKG